MDPSPLIKAHDHARAASNATQTSDTTVAINEHALAAGEFSNAAKSTTSAEALRTLGLLEQHHRRLSELLKLPLEPISQPSSADGDIPEEDENESPTGQEERRGTDTDTGTHKSQSSRSSSTSVASSSPGTAKPPPPTLSHPPRKYPGGRDLSSSIASNLASARGIRSKYRGQALTPSVSNDQAPGSLEVHPRREGSSTRHKAPDNALDGSRKQQPGWVPPTAKTEVSSDFAKSERGSPTPTPSDDGFSRFYSTFGSLINRLSAPLAFAGLPLIAEESTTTSEPAAAAAPEPATIASAAQKKLRPKPSSTATPNLAEPDLSKIFSRTTMRSLARDGHAANDSFYVVPTSGHTATYASILNHESKEKRRTMAASTHDTATAADNDGEDDFVDAQESQSTLPLSPAFRKRLGTKPRTERDLQTVIEELHLENASLKEMVDKLSKRLHAFELNSQSSHLALAQSLRFQRPASPLSAAPPPAAPPPAADEALWRKRSKEAEDQLSAAVARAVSLEKDNAALRQGMEKLEQNLERYREKWKDLKAGAKARREAQGQGQGSGPGQATDSDANRSGR
ncbi:hypothetical protein B0T22DRAFT_143656 [Podospora appendiculata]|uniref:Uncharacterized protein n=1 Tax=Podospora appendiculata TaxID=314037 RepID=A0AAE1CBY8_9PEZI|nr:hypothetical protein B0T22DRAFT_143656 [Podospora appendiculata]